MHGHIIMLLCNPNACDGRACACAGKAHASMKRTYNGKYTENCWAGTETLPKELAGLH